MPRKNIFRRWILLELLVLMLACVGIAGYVLVSASGLLGFEAPQTWLIQAQNSDELRGSGGFISGIGTFRLERGRLTNLQLADSYAVDDFTKPYPPPPDPLMRYMLAGVWVPRDANWSPDFPTSARKAAELYNLSTGTAVQGVVAFDQAAVREILKVLGPVQVAGEDQAVSADQVEAYMQSAWGAGSTTSDFSGWYAHRKDFMAQLGKAIVERVLQTRDPGRLLQLIEEGLALIREGHLQVYSTDNRVQLWLNRLGLDGSLVPGEGDTLMLVDSNIGFNKMDGVMQRALAYQVDLRDPEHPAGRVTLAYANPVQQDVACVHQASYGEETGQISYQNMQERCYWDYWRLYFPAGTALASAQAEPVSGSMLLSKQDWLGQVETLRELPGLQTFAGLVVVPPNANRQVNLYLKLPKEVVKIRGEAGEYRLRMQKQAGLEQLLVSLEVLLPDGSHVQSGTTLGGNESAGVWRWQGTVRQATDFVVRYGP